MGCLKDTATNRDDSLEVQRGNINADIKHAVNRDCVCVCAYSVPVHETPDCCSHFTGKQDHQKEEELQIKDIYFNFSDSKD